MEHLQPKESLEIIQTIINERKQKYEQNGLVFIFWGGLISVSSLFNYFTGNPMSWYILMPLGFIFTFIYYFISGKNKEKSNNSLDWTDWIWSIAGLCAMFVGFYLILNLGEFAFSFINILIFQPFIFACLATALRLKNILWTITSLLALAFIFLSFSMDITWKEETLKPTIISILIFIIPGIQLFINYKKRKNV